MLKRIKKILVANRGEIAIRILRTAQEMGAKSVAVYSEGDLGALHTTVADEAICIGPAESQKSYLNQDALIEAARKSGANAIHPGYGFLSENASFAKRCEKEGLIFIGPQSDAIERMGDKVVARSTVAQKSVPTTPGTGAITDLAQGLKTIEKLLDERPDFRFPLLIKAAGGGGGKGMRICRDRSSLKENLERAQSEATKAFNNPTIFVERYIEEPRHIEVQVLGDGQKVLHLFERECSMQRRHQKVVEEALSPSISPDLREKILKAAVQAAESVNYKSAGTVEFIVSQQEDFYFLEMNTRIQVEHPVTEWITGVDLIRWQILLADGQPLSLEQSMIRQNGHSIEVRLYAEDAENGFLPQPGMLHFLRFPQWTGVRVDSAVQSPTQISSFYDPMIAKISAWAPDREHCRNRMKNFLEQTRVEGLITNRSFLLDILNSEPFRKGRYHTQFLESAGWRPTRSPSSLEIAGLCLKDHLEGRLDLESTSLSRWQQEAYALEA